MYSYLFIFIIWYLNTYSCKLCMFIIKNEMDEKLKYKSSCKNVLLE